MLKNTFIKPSVAQLYIKGKSPAVLASLQQNHNQVISVEEQYFNVVLKHKLPDFPLMYSCATDGLIKIC